MDKKLTIWTLLNILLIAVSCAGLWVVFHSGEVVFIIFGTIGILAVGGISIGKARTYAYDDGGFFAKLIANAVAILYAVSFVAMIFVSISLG